MNEFLIGWKRVLIIDEKEYKSGSNFVINR